MRVALWSHAALVAREKQVPCIIGTRIATRALKDGDIIKVDADNGLITKKYEQYYFGHTPKKY